MVLKYNNEIGKFVFDERMKGRTYQDIADELGVVVSTTYNWFYIYFENLMKENNDEELTTEELLFCLRYGLCK